MPIMGHSVRVGIIQVLLVVTCVSGMYAGEPDVDALVPRLREAAARMEGAPEHAYVILRAAQRIKPDDFAIRHAIDVLAPEVRKRNYLRPIDMLPPRTPTTNDVALARDLVNSALARAASTNIPSRALAFSMILAARAVDRNNVEARLYYLQGIPHGNDTGPSPTAADSAPDPAAATNAVATAVPVTPPTPPPAPVALNSDPATPMKFGLAPGFASQHRALLREQSTIKGLVVVDLGENKYVGSTLGVIATSVHRPPVGEFAAQFRYGSAVSAPVPPPPPESMRPTGKDRSRHGDPIATNTPPPTATIGNEMLASLNEAERAVRVRYPQWDPQTSIEVTFDRQHMVKDGPSATTALALALLGLLDNIEFQRDTAITGELSRDWVVGSVGGICAKITGAARSGCARVIIPAPNQREACDLLVLGEASILTRIEVLTASNLVDALRFTRADPDPALAEASARFARIRKGFETRVYSTSSPSPSLQRELQEILTRVPQHLSARLLLMQVTGRFDRRLSLSESLRQICAAVLPVIHGDYSDAACRTASDRLARIRVLMDSRARNCCTHAEDLLRNVSQSTWTGARASLNALSQELRTLQADTSVPEDLPTR
jgi:hypothetical protein